MRVNSYEYPCLIDQFWFEYELHISSSRIQIFGSLLCWHFIYTQLNIWISFHAHLSRMLLHVAITLFSPAHPHAHFMFLLFSQTWSLDVSLEKCHTLPIIIHYTVSLSLTSLSFSGITRYLSILFSPPHTHSHSSFTLSFSLGFSHAPYMSLAMTPTTKNYSLPHTQRLLQSPFHLHLGYKTDIIHLFTDQTNTTRKRAIDRTDSNGAPGKQCATTIY